MAIRTEIVTPTLLENTTMEKVFIDEVHKKYRITPNEGYVLHDNRYDDYTDYDEEGNGIGEPILGYRTSTASCSVAQFENNTYDFYAVPISNVPENRVFGVINPPEPEVM